MKKLTKRFIALFCIICMMSSLCLNTLSTLAGSGADITLTNAPERKFTQWTFCDVGIADKTLTDNDLWNTDYTNGKSLDKTIFTGKIKFSNDHSSQAFGNFYIGAKDPASGSKWRGFIFTANGADKLNFGFVGTDGCFFDANGKTTNTSNGFLAVFDPAVAGTTLRGNADLQVSLSVEYVNQTSDKTDLKLGVFFDGKLYDNTYYTVKDVPLGYLTQTIRFYPTGKTNAVTSATIQVQDITLDTAPEKDFEEWTFSSVGIADKTLTDNDLWNTEYTNGKSLDKTIFTGKIKFSNDHSSQAFGNFYIGAKDPASGSKWRGFIFTANGADKLNFGFVGTDGCFFDANGKTTNASNGFLAVFDPAVAGTTLRGNADLQVSLSVEYVNKTSDKTDLKLGVFFDGKLYDNTYYTVKDVPLGYLTQTIRFYPTGKTNAVASATNKVQDITIDTAPEKDFEEWTFSSVGIADKILTDNDLWNTEYTNGKSLDKTIFTGKIKFSNDHSSQAFGNFYIGAKDPASGSKWRGFIFTANGADKLNFGFVGTDGCFFDANGKTTNASNGFLAVFDPAVAGTTLRGNADLQVSLSVEYVNQTSDKTDLKLGVFFDGKLYDNTYYTVKDVPLGYLTQTIRFYPTGKTNAVASATNKVQDITIDTAPEKDFEEWTFSSVGIADKILTDNDLWNTEYTNGKSLDKTIFTGKIKFSNDHSSQAFGNFYIGAKDPASGSKWRGFIFTANGADKLNFGFVGTDGCFFDANGKTTNASNGFLAVFDPAVAGTTLRGNADLQVSLSVEYVNKTSDKTDLKLGVFFDGKLYDNTYYTVKDVPLGYLTQTIRFNPTGKTNAVASATNKDPVTPPPADDIYLDNTPEKDFTEWTFATVGIADQKIAGNLNWITPNISKSLDKTLFRGKIQFADDSTKIGNLYIGGAVTGDISQYRGFIIRGFDDADPNLTLGFAGPDGIFYNKDGASNEQIAMFYSGKAGVALRGNSDLEIALSVEFTSVTDGKADLKVGVFFNEKLYDNTYYTVKDVPVEYLTQNIRWYAPLGTNMIASVAIAGGGSLEDDFNGINSSYEELTMNDFSIFDAKIDSVKKGKDWRAENYCDKDTLDGSAVSVVCNFPEKSTARFSVGGTFWRGVFVGSLSDGTLEVGYISAAGEAKKIAYLDAQTAGMDKLTGRELTIRLTFDIDEKTAEKGDLRLGIYVNGKLYENRHRIVRDVDLETMTRTMKLYVTAAPFEIKSVVTAPDLSKFGFNNQTWKDEI